MTTNKVIINFTIIIIFIIIAIPTGYKVIKNHQNKLLESTEAKIITAAKKCYYDKACTNDKILLKELYEKDYLEVLSNPISKENYNENAYIEIKDNKFIFISE